MSDTPWPRFEVFQQDRPGKPHQNAGSVHALDAEMALQNARDVFVRRPECHNIWVVPADDIFAKTAEELAADSAWQEEDVDPNAPEETYHVFQKTSQRRSMTYVWHVGDVEAASPSQALKKALHTFTEKEASVWWVCPAVAVTRSEETDVTPMFQPARDKPFRLPSHYRTVYLMHKLKQAEEAKRQKKEEKQSGQKS